MSSRLDVVIGIDGGGTHTRVLIADLEGNKLSYTEKGASSIKKDLKAVENVHEAIREALSLASCEISNVKGITAGIAGLDSVEDYKWADELVSIEGLNCPKWIVNDAVIAQSGAFLMEPGIVVVSGTGSIIFAINESGKEIRNFDFHQYAYSAARFLSYDVIFEILSGNINHTDQHLVEAVLTYWNVKNINELRLLGLEGFIEDERERNRFFGRMGILVTEAANDGSDLAKRVCNRSIHQLVVGIEILGSCFSSDFVPVAYIGSVLASPYMKTVLTESLQQRSRKIYEVRDPVLSAVSGAVLMALTKLELPITEEIINRLKKI
ncbi:glucosamine kinase [Gracilibacillus ureilyticus]|uniref:Glucosamine kinase n=1 Tax=Gracilibacillus ureilyticus TaxID=531814 RepID=A0A1H9MLD3_9BACI|nr:BadF/BadG/BcrA/BcrD ATPase family protein [Gracilibacillus ureilyticus]SER23963.1 glucosamine kinase [Gracilibacillus ureilyticus]